jgi:hypothetical protein
MTLRPDTRCVHGPEHTEATKSPPISPELALVDPELAAAARALLPGPGRFLPAWNARPTATGTAHARSLAPIAEQLPPTTPIRPRTRHVRRAILVACVVAAAASVVGALGSAPTGRHEAAPRPAVGPFPRALQQARATRQARAARTYTWPAVPGAQTYEIRLLRGRQPVWEAITLEPAVELPARLRLSPGRYTWSATPGFEKPLLDAAARPVVEATFQISSS